MVFASLFFLFVFLPLNILLYFLFKKQEQKNWVLILFSLFFYAWGEPIWIILLIFSAAVDYANGLFIGKHKGTPLAKLGVLSSVLINIGLLMTFKYSDFIVENVNAIFGSTFKEPSFMLPIGISFYTFQTISYTIDVYKGRVDTQRSFPRFLMFVSLYHQLVAGPIVRYSEIDDEINDRKTTKKDISDGITRFSRGLFKKVFIANTAGELATQYLTADFSTLSSGAGWFGLVMFSIQIYFDFSGYSDMAIGLGRIFGFHYNENFKHPYIANSITDFWRRWHISLGTFFRDYIYIPLGGNKKNQIFNLFVVWFLTGFWHGASWNYILWGLYFGVLVALEKIFILEFFKRIPKVIHHIYSLFFIIIGWALFYYTDLGQLTQFMKIIFGFTDNPGWDLSVQTSLLSNIYWLAFALLISMPIYPALKDYVSSKLKSENTYSYVIIGFNLIFLLISIALLVGKSYNPFLYFRF